MKKRMVAFKIEILLLLIIVALISCSKNNPTTPPINTGKVPFPVLPQDGSAINDASIKLVVRNADSYNGAGSTYLFQIADNKNFGNIVFQQEVSGGSGTTSLVVTYSFSTEKFYYWHVKASKTGQSTGYSVAFMFILHSSSVAPQPLSPPAEKVEMSGSVVLKAKNSPYFSTANDIYRFELFSIVNSTTPIIVKEVQAQPDTTLVDISEKMKEGAYTWRVRAYRSAGGDSEGTLFSEPVKFYIAENCNKFHNGPWAIRVSSTNITCGPYNSYQNADEALGIPNARELSPDVYEGFVSLGIDGWVVYEMGECIRNGSGYDLGVFQSVSYEGVGVAVAETPDGPWHFLGAVPCGDHSDYWSKECFFDLSYEDTNVPWARFVKVIDYERLTMPDKAFCDVAAPFPGADIDAVVVVNPY